MASPLTHSRPGRPDARRARSGSRFSARTRQPSARRRSATAPPTPPVAPITSAVLASLLVCTGSLLSLLRQKMGLSGPQQNCRILWSRYSAAHAWTERLGPLPKPSRRLGGRHAVRGGQAAWPHPADTGAAYREPGTAPGLAALPAQPARPAAH